MSLSYDALSRADRAVEALSTFDYLVYHMLHHKVELGRMDAEGLSALMVPHLDTLREVLAQLRKDASDQPPSGRRAPSPNTGAASREASVDRVRRQLEGSEPSSSGEPTGSASNVRSV